MRTPSLPWVVRIFLISWWPSPSNRSATKTNPLASLVLLCSHFLFFFVPSCLLHVFVGQYTTHKVKTAECEEEPKWGREEEAWEVQFWTRPKNRRQKTKQKQEGRRIASQRDSESGGQIDGWVVGTGGDGCVSRIGRRLIISRHLSGVGSSGWETVRPPSYSQSWVYSVGAVPSSSCCVLQPICRVCACVVYKHSFPQVVVDQCWESRSANRRLDIADLLWLWVFFFASG